MMTTKWGCSVTTKTYAVTFDDAGRSVLHVDATDECDAVILAHRLMDAAGVEWVPVIGCEVSMLHKDERTRAREELFAEFGKKGGV